MSLRSREELYHLMHSCYWWHSIDLGRGLITPGKKSIETLDLEFDRTFKGVSLHGKRVLDVGAWNGGFTAEAARRGAVHITAVDHVTWNDPVWKGRLSFDIVVGERGIPATAFDIDVDAPGLSLKQLGTFDIVLFLGVFYHLIDPISALREVAAAATEVLVVETYVDRELDPSPVMRLYPGKELANDPTNWWGPSCACVEGLLRTFGFSRVETTAGADVNRAVFHAWR